MHNIIFTIKVYALQVFYFLSYKSYKFVSMYIGGYN
jgi:hypothetical protein